MERREKGEERRSQKREQEPQRKRERKERRRRGAVGGVDRQTVKEMERFKTKKQVSENQEGGQESRKRMEGEEGLEMRAAIGQPPGHTH